MSDHQPAPRGATITPNRSGGHAVVVNGRDISAEITQGFTVRVEGQLTYLDVSYAFGPSEVVTMERTP